MSPVDTEDGHKFLNEFLAKYAPIDFIIFDNLMSLSINDLREEDGWRALKSFVLSLTRRAIGQLWIHHVGHDKSRSYGTKTREWHMDAVLIGESLAERQDADVAFRLRFPKARRRTPANRADFDDVEITLSDGEWQSAKASGDPKQKRTALTPNGRLVLKALRVAIQETGKKPPHHDRTRHVEAAVTEDQWRRYFDQIAAGTNDSTRRSQWNRGVTDVLSKAFAEKWGPHIWVSA